MGFVELILDIIDSVWNMDKNLESVRKMKEEHGWFGCLFPFMVVGAIVAFVMFVSWL